MQTHYNETTWTIIPDKTPLIIRPCSKCNKKKAFYCSEKFRLNGRHTKIDIWLIYKCVKCDTTFKLTIKRGIKPHDISPERFDQFTNNDKALAWQYAFDRQLLKQSDCDIQYADVPYSIQCDAPASTNAPLRIHIQSPYLFELKLGALLAGQLGISISKIKKLADNETITASLDCDIVKYRIRTDLDIFINPYTSSS